jgi:putative nucleotidyltransferase with HDIG domain
LRLQYIKIAGNLLTVAGVQDVQVIYEEELTAMDGYEREWAGSPVLGGFVQLVTSMVNVHDPTSVGHQEQVAVLAREIARAMRPDERMADYVYLAGMVHDVGKITIPCEVLTVPGKLNSLQRMIVAQHPRTGYDMIKPIDFPTGVADIVYHHHERLDGSGYPLGLRGDQISLESRILAVADVAQAMCSSRTYRTACCVDNVLEELETHKGTLYDAGAVDICKRLLKEQAWPGIPT